MAGLSKTPEATSAKLRAAWTPERRAARAAWLKEENEKTGQAAFALKLRWERYYSRTDIKAARALRALKNKFYNRHRYLREKIRDGTLAIGDEVGPYRIEDIWELWEPNRGRRVGPEAQRLELICIQCGNQKTIKMGDLPSEIYGVCVQVGKTLSFVRHGIYPVGYRPWEFIQSCYVSVYRGPKEPIVSYPPRREPKVSGRIDKDSDRDLHERMANVLRGRPKGPGSLGDRTSRGR